MNSPEAKRATTCSATELASWESGLATLGSLLRYQRIGANTNSIIMSMTSPVERSRLASSTPMRSRRGGRNGNGRGRVL